MYNDADPSLGQGVTGAVIGGDLVFLVRDRFRRGDNPTSLGVADTGQPWIAIRNTWGTIGGFAYPSAGQANGTAVVDAGNANGRVGVTIARLDPRRIHRLCFRVNDWDNQWVISNQDNDTRLDNGKLHLFLVQNGMFRSIRVIPYSWHPGDEVSVDLDGPSITVLMNGNPLFRVEDPALMDATKHGIGGEVGETLYADFFVAVPFVAVPVVTPPFVQMPVPQPAAPNILIPVLLLASVVGIAAVVSKRR